MDTLNILDLLNKNKVLLANIPGLEKISSIAEQESNSYDNVLNTNPSPTVASVQPDPAPKDFQGVASIPTPSGQLSNVDQTKNQNMTVQPQNNLTNVLTKSKSTGIPNFEVNIPMSQAEQNWSHVPGIGQIPLNTFVQLAGMTANALDPNGPGGRLGASLANYAAKQEDNKLNDLLKKTQLMETYSKIQNEPFANALKKIEGLEKFSSYIDNIVAKLDPERNPKGYLSTVSYLENLSSSFGIPIQFPRVEDYVITDKNGNKIFDREGFNDAKAAAITNAKEELKMLYERPNAELKMYESPDGRQTGWFPVDKRTGNVEKLPSGWVPKDKVEPMTWQSALAKYRLTGDMRYKRIADDLYRREFTMRDITRPEKEPKYGKFFDPVRGTNVTLPISEGIDRGMDAEVSIPSSKDLAAIRSIALTGKYNGKKIDPTGYIEQYNKFATGSTILRPAVMQDKRLGVSVGEPYVVAKEVKLPKVNGKQLTAVDIRYTLQKHPEKSLNDILRDLGVIE